MVLLELPMHTQIVSSSASKYAISHYPDGYWRNECYNIYYMCVHYCTSSRFLRHTEPEPLGVLELESSIDHIVCIIGR